MHRPHQKAQKKLLKKVQKNKKKKRPHRDLNADIKLRRLAYCPGYTMGAQLIFQFALISHVYQDLL